MCFWGEAFALGSNINGAMHEEVIAPAFQAIRKVKALKRAITDNEGALIDALTERYITDAMEQVGQNRPDDRIIPTFYADALVNLQP